MFHIYQLSLCLIVLTSSGCSGISSTSHRQPHQSCTEDWFQLVEQRYQSNDNQGHGPGLGTSEWRSSIEFKIGIDNDAKVPALETNQWCTYINNHYIRTIPN